MASQLDICADLIAQVSNAVSLLDRQIGSFELTSLDRRDWYELLHQKLLPQLGQEAFLIVAVVGGTNIGKSVVFNHVAGDRLSATSPLASGTKHPTAILPSGFSSTHNLSKLFPGFRVSEWVDADAPLAENPQHLLYWRESESLPENLVVLDTPDVDSVAEVNWERADHIRLSADVLLAVLTQQKYNDSAVKEFFRKASDEGKLVIVIFNQVLLPEDGEYWPLWLKTFEAETGLNPHSVYIAPNDRRAAESNALPFYEQNWPQEDGEFKTELTERNLLRDLSELRFSEIKLQTLEGAIDHLCSPEVGIPSWLSEIRRRGAEFGEALNLMSAQRLVEVDRWPGLPNSVMIRKIREWWARQREGWSRSVHGFYHAVGTAVAYPVKLLMETKGNSVTPIEEYRAREWEVILQALENTLERLSWLEELDNPRLSPKLKEILGGKSRAELIEKFRLDHQELDFERILDEMINRQLSGFREESPESYKLFRRIDTLAAAARPAVSVGLFMTGVGPVGDVLYPAVADTAMQGMFHLATDAVGGTVVTAVGDKVITEGASTSAGYLESKFRRLHTQFAQQRAEWLASELERHLFGNLPEELARAAKIGDAPEFKQVEKLVNELRHLLATTSVQNS